MIQALDILRTAHEEQLEAGLSLFYTKQREVEGAFQYEIKRYQLHKTWLSEDTGMMVYHVEKQQQNSYLELRFCISGNRYCENKDCNTCTQDPSTNCSGKHETVDVFRFNFSTSFLQPFIENVNLSNHKDEVVAFRHPNPFTKLFPLCNRKRVSLDGLVSHNFTGVSEHIYTTARIHEVLLYSLECLVEEREEGFNCRFLADESGREKIYLAREILLKHIGEPLTIKELSRKVATNECYLKKGFKEVYGTTIFEFYQQQRMEHAKYLLYEKSLSVTDVSALLGYSSISHFSAAFKKQTGLKPCDLLR